MPPQQDTQVLRVQYKRASQDMWVYPQSTRVQCSTVQHAGLSEAASQMMQHRSMLCKLPCARRQGARKQLFDMQTLMSGCVPAT